MSVRISVIAEDYSEICNQHNVSKPSAKEVAKIYQYCKADL